MGQQSHRHKKAIRQNLQKPVHDLNRALQIRYIYGSGLFDQERTNHRYRQPKQTPTEHCRPSWTTRDLLLSNQTEIEF